MLANKPINIVIADDHPAVRAGIEATLLGHRSIRIVGAAANSSEIVELLSRHACDMLITDFAMPGGKCNDGLRMLAYLRTHYPELKIIVFTGFDGAALTTKLLKLGIRAIVSKSDDVRHLTSALYAVHANAEYLSPHVSAAAGEKRIGRRHLGLTKSEVEVLRLYISGMSVTEIAARQNRTKQTVSAQKIKAMRKLGVERDADLYQLVHESRRGLTDIFDA